MKIESVSGEGCGVGRADGMAVFVPFTVDGDEAEVRIVRVCKSYAYGIVEKLITPSEYRVEPKCEYFSKCGGCDYRHIDYAHELEIKRRQVSDALTRLGGLNISVENTVYSDSIDAYRNKSQFPFTQTPNRLSLGFYAKRSHRVIPIRSCALSDDIVSRIALRCCELLHSFGLCAYDEQSGKGLLRHLLIRKSGLNGDIMVCVVVNANGFSAENDFAKTLCGELKCVKTVVVNVNRTRGNVILGERCRTIIGEGYITDEMCGISVRISPRSFFQINTPAAEKLYALAAQFAAPQADDTLLDLYCGTGTIGLSIAKRAAFSKLIGVETERSAVEDAFCNAQALGVSERCEFLCSDASDAASLLAKRSQQIDVVITDPPRKGCDEKTLEAICTMSPKRLVMISCNPATLARDLRFLCEHGYLGERAVPVDLFPRTAHVECVVLLTKSN